MLLCGGHEERGPWLPGCCSGRPMGRGRPMGAWQAGGAWLGGGDRPAGRTVT